MKDYLVPISLIMTILGGIISFVYVASEVKMNSNINKDDIISSNKRFDKEIEKVYKRFDLELLEINQKYSILDKKINETRKENQELRIRIWDILNDLRAVVYRLEGRMLSENNENFNPKRNRK